MQKLFQRFLVSILLVSLGVIAPLNQAGLNITYAQRATVVVGGNGTIQDTISAGMNTITAGLQNAFFIKEFSLDGIAHGLAKMVLKSMTQSILNWINSGFQGKPAFVTDLKQFLRDRVDETVGDFISNDPALNFLCSPFQLDVKVALAESYRQSAHDGFGSKAQCTLSQVTDNVEGFLNGGFNNGGFNSWFEVTQNPVNTPTGAYLAAETEMYARIIDEQGRSIKELDWGDGFLSFKVCGDETNKQNCSISTPGRVIADQINKSLGAGQDELIAADEINEIISALFSQLAKMAITGIGGLLGLSQANYSGGTSLPPCSGNNSYLDQLCQEEATGTSSTTAKTFSDAIAQEQANTALQNSVISLVDGAEATLNAAIAAEGVCMNLNSTEAQTLQTLVDRRDQAKLRVLKNNGSIAAITTMETNYNATTSPSIRQSIMNDFTNKLIDGTFTGPQENTLLQVDVNYTFKNTVDSFVSQIDAKERRCSSGGGGGGDH